MVHRCLLVAIILIDPIERMGPEISISVTMSKVRVTVRMVKRSFQLITGSMSRHTEGLRRTGTMTSKYVDLFSKYTSTWSKLIVGAKRKYQKPFS